MKKSKVKVSKSVKMKKLLVCCFLVFVVMSLMSVAAFASGASTGTVTDPNASFDTIIKFIAGWIGKLGLVVGFIGGGSVRFCI